MQKKNWNKISFDVGDIDLVVIITDLFIVTVAVINILSIGIKFQSNSVNDGQVIAGRISTTFLPVKYSHVVVASLYYGVRFLLYMG